MIRIPENVLKFANGNVDLYKAWGDYFNHYKAIYFGANVPYDTEKSFEHKTEKLNQAIMDEISRHSGVPNIDFKTNPSLATNPNVVWATFAVISSMVDMVIPDVVARDFMNFAEVRNGGFGDSFVFDIEPNDLFIVTKIGRGKRHTVAQRQFTNQVVLVPELRAITVQEDLYRILCGKRNLADYAMKCALALEKALSLDVYAAINDTYSKLPASFREASFTPESFVKLAQRVQAANGGAKCVVFGTKLALSKILPSDDYLKVGLGDTYNRAGYLATFMGVDLFEIPQKIDDTSENYEFALDDNRLYFISTGVQKLVKIVFEGQTFAITNDRYSNADLSQVTTMQKSWAVGVITNAKYGIMDVSA